MVQDVNAFSCLQFTDLSEHGAVQDVEVASDTDYTKLAGLLEGFSGDDCTSVCRDAAMNGLRRKITGKTPEEIRCALLRSRHPEQRMVRMHFLKLSQTETGTVFHKLLLNAKEMQGDEPQGGPGPCDHGGLYAGVPASPASSLL